MREQTKSVVLIYARIISFHSRAATFKNRCLGTHIVSISCRVARHETCSFYALASGRQSRWSLSVRRQRSNARGLNHQFWAHPWCTYCRLRNAVADSPRGHPSRWSLCTWSLWGSMDSVLPPAKQCGWCPTQKKINTLREEYAKYCNITFYWSMTILLAALMSPMKSPSTILSILF